MRMLCGILLLLCCGSVVQAQDEPTPALLVYNAWVRPTAPALAADATPEPPLPDTVSGAFMLIQNVSDQDYTLVGVSDDFAAMTQLHTTSMDGGVMKMQMVDGIDIPAGETVELASGGYHVMLMNVTRDLYPDTAVALRLTFADASGATFDIPVGALVTDFPAESSSLIVANAIGRWQAGGYVDISFTLVNQSDQADVLTNVSSDRAGIEVSPTTAVDIPAQGMVNYGADVPANRLSGFAEPPQAVLITLTFQSGMTQTVAVPVVDPTVSATAEPALSMDMATAEASMPMDMPMPAATEAAS